MLVCKTCWSQLLVTPPSPTPRSRPRRPGSQSATTSEQRPAPSSTPETASGEGELSSRAWPQGTLLGLLQQLVLPRQVTWADRQPGLTGIVLPVHRAAQLQQHRHAEIYGPAAAALYNMTNLLQGHINYVLPSCSNGKSILAVISLASCCITIGHVIRQTGIAASSFGFQMVICSR